MEKIDITQKLAEFQDHLEQNPRTIFSARFGDGKTYFLREFMNSYGKDYFFVNIRPINYVVAPNEDVFEYIKRDILQELCMYYLVDDHVLNNVLKGIVNMDNAVEAVSFVAQTFLKLKSSIEAPIGETLKNFSTNFNEHCQTLKKYNTSFEIQRGGLYEEDAYTMLIRESLLKVQKRTKDSKKCVLVIEDLDRLDPGHLFRILNVLGAHIDNDKDTNKFGFDKIVLVMDYDTTRHIFHHFYGTEANYEGYMDKFSSSHVFRYSISQLAQQMLLKKIHEETEPKILDVIVEGYVHRPKSVTLRHVIESLSVRKVEQILDQLDSMWIKDTVEVKGRVLSTRTPIAYILALLTLINQNYKQHSVYELIDKADPMLYSRQFVYAYEDIEQHSININDQQHVIILPVLEDDVITGIQTRTYTEREKLPIGTADVNRAAWKLAVEVIRDADKIKLVIE